MQWLENEGWQQQLWKKVFGKKLPTATVRPLDGSFFFYHISNIAPYQWEAFSKMDTSWFLFSPSQMYMGDFIPERQQKYFLRNVKEPVKRKFTLAVSARLSAAFKLVGAWQGAAKAF